MVNAQVEHDVPEAVESWHGQGIEFGRLFRRDSLIGLLRLRDSLDQSAKPVYHSALSRGP